MTRRPELSLLSPPALLAAAERILAQPTCNVQRVALDEIYTFAVATTQFVEVCGLAARQLAGEATPDELSRLRTHLIALGILPPTFTPPRKETADGQG